MSYTITPATPGAPIFPNLLTSPSGTLSKPNVTTFSPDFKQLRMQQANLQVQQSLANDYSITAGVQYYGGRHIPVLIDVNLGAPVGILADGRPLFSSPTGSTPASIKFCSCLRSRILSITVGFWSSVKRFSKSFQFTASYTLGWAFNANDSTGDSGSNVTDSTSLRRDYGPSSSDQRHRFVLERVWQPRSRNLLLDGWMVARRTSL